LQEYRSIPGPEPCAIEYRSFSRTGSPFDTKNPDRLERKAVEQYLQRETDYPIKNALMLFRPYHGVVVVTVESAQSDKVMDGLVRRLKQLAKDQLTATRPSFICVRFSDLTENELLELAKGDEAGDASSLQRATSMLLDRDDWRHVHTVAYVVPGHLNIFTSENRRIRTEMAQETGPSYSFANPHNESASDNRLKVF
jgi:hypothetical protein